MKKGKELLWWAFWEAFVVFLVGSGDVFWGSFMEGWADCTFLVERMEVSDAATEGISACFTGEGWRFCGTGGVVCTSLEGSVAFKGTLSVGIAGCVRVWAGAWVCLFGLETRFFCSAWGRTCGLEKAGGTSGVGKSNGGKPLSILWVL